MVAVFYLMPARLKPYWLVAASFYFYMSWIKQYGLLLAAILSVNYVLGIAIYKASLPRIRRLMLIVALAVNLGALAIYKYTDFIIDSVWHGLQSVAPWLPASITLPATSPILNVLLPLGISFFAFEFIHYAVDIYKGSKPIFSPVRFALFGSFFPSQIAGPIKRYQDFDKQVDDQLNGRAKRFDVELFESGLWLILKGMFKKVALGDNLGALVSAGFGANADLGAMDAWVCIFAFALQVYFDFSGYTDIGRGSAMLLGFRLPENFALPYLATSFPEFWRRWHLSLSTWLRDYLFFPLGGSRGGEAKTARNIMLTMTLAGLWHGAAWHYVIWGAYQGVFIYLHRAWDLVCRKVAILDSIRKHKLYVAPAWLLNIFVILVGYVMFCAKNVPHAIEYYKVMFSLQPSPHPISCITLQFFESTLPITLLLYAAFSIVVALYKRNKQRQQEEGIPGIIMPSSPAAFWLTPPASARFAVYAGVAFAIVGFSPAVAQPFIYFQF